MSAAVVGLDHGWLPRVVPMSVHPSVRHGAVVWSSARGRAGGVLAGEGWCARCCSQTSDGRRWGRPDVESRRGQPRGPSYEAGGPDRHGSHAPGRRRFSRRDAGASPRDARRRHRRRLVARCQLRRACRPSGVWHRGGSPPGCASPGRRWFRWSCRQNERANAGLDRVDSTTVANPILWEKGIKVMLGVPLLSEDAVLGVLHVGRTANRPFDDDDLRLLQVVGERIAAAIHTRALAVERAATLLLERSLLPPTLPKCPGLAFAVRFVPAENRTVGGDWYDLFVLPSGQLWLVVGDVAGHGLQAAVVMGRLRSALRRVRTARHLTRSRARPCREESRAVRVRHLRDHRLRSHFAAVRHAHDRHRRASAAGRRRAGRTCELPEARAQHPHRSTDEGGEALDDDPARRPAPSSPSTPMASSSGAVSPSRPAWRGSRKRCRQSIRTGLPRTSCGSSSETPSRLTTSHSWSCAGHRLRTHRCHCDAVNARHAHANSIDSRMPGPSRLTREANEGPRRTARSLRWRIRSEDGEEPASADEAASEHRAAVVAVTRG